MPEVRGQLARRVAWEVLAWYCVAGLFLAAYVGLLGGRLAGVLPHLRLVTEAVLVLAALRVALSAVLPPRAARVMSTGIAVAAFAVLVAYYVLEAMSLRSWGRVITWDLIISHGRGTWLMFDAMGVSAWWAALAAVVIGAALLVLARFHARHLDWVGLLASRTRAAPRGFAALALLAVLTIDLHEYVILPPIEEREPVTLTFFSTRRAIRMQNNGVDRAASERRDVDQDAAPAAYRAMPNATPRNGILIVGDALRADHMDAYGYPRETTPNLASLPAAGILRVPAPAHTVC